MFNPPSGFEFSATFHQQILDSSPVGHIYYGPVQSTGGELIDLEVRYFNTRALTAHGPSLAIGQRLLALYGAGQDWLPSLGALPADGSPYDQEHYVASTGAWHRLTFAACGSGVLQTLEDITGTRQQTELLQAVLDENIHPLVLLVAQRGPQGELTGFRYGLTNRINAQIAGLSPGELVGRRWEEVFPDIFHTGLYQQVVDTLDKMQARRFRISSRHRGPRQFTDVSLMPYRDGVLMQLIDVTDTVRYQRRLEWLARTQQGALESLQEYTKVAAHDLKEPVRKISTLTEVLQSQYGSGLPEVAHHLVERVGVAARRLQQLLADLLTYSALSRRTIRPGRVNLDGLVREVLTDYGDRLRQSGARVRVGTLPPVPGDAYGLRLLLESLVSNALKFHRPGQAPHLAIRGGVRQDPVLAGGTKLAGAYAVLTVRDRGLGIEKRHQQLVFGLFNRLHGPDRYEGTGLGLALCRRVAEAHGGCIELESEPGAGTQVRVYLPLAEDPALPGE